MSCEKQVELLSKIQELEFIALELNLYLDTHPCDEEALRDYQQAVETAAKYVRKYEAEYGPLYNFGVSHETSGSWRWINGPWPWEL